MAAGQYAVIRTGGKQYRVTPGQKLMVEKLAGEAGTSVTLNEVLLASAGEGQVKVGTPLLKGATVTARILAEKKAAKVVIYKKIRRTGYTKKQGHRQPMSEIQIESINA